MIEKLKQLIAQYKEISSGFDEILVAKTSFEGCVTQEQIREREVELRAQWEKVRKSANAKMAEIMVLRQEIEKENERCVQFLKDCRFLTSGLNEKFWTKEEKERNEEYKRSYTSKGFEVPAIDGFSAIKLFTL